MLSNKSNKSLFNNEFLLETMRDRDKISGGQAITELIDLKHLEDSPEQDNKIQSRKSKESNKIIFPKGKKDKPDKDKGVGHIFSTEIGVGAGAFRQKELKQQRSKSQHFLQQTQTKKIKITKFNEFIKIDEKTKEIRERKFKISKETNVLLNRLRAENYVNSVYRKNNEDNLINEPWYLLDRDVGQHDNNNIEDGSENNGGKRNRNNSNGYSKSLKEKKEMEEGMDFKFVKMSFNIKQTLANKNEKEERNKLNNFTNLKRNFSNLVRSNLKIIQNNTKSIENLHLQPNLMLKLTNEKPITNLNGSISTFFNKTNMKALPKIDNNNNNSTQTFKKDSSTIPMSINIIETNKIEFFPKYDRNTPHKQEIIYDNDYAKDDLIKNEFLPNLKKTVYSFKK